MKMLEPMSLKLDIPQRTDMNFQIQELNRTISFMVIMRGSNNMGLVMQLRFIGQMRDVIDESE